MCVSGTLCNQSEHARFLEDILIHKTVCCGKPLFGFGRCDCSAVCVRAFRLATRACMVCESALQFALCDDWFVAGSALLCGKWMLWLWCWRVVWAIGHNVVMYTQLLYDIVSYFQTTFANCTL